MAPGLFCVDAVALLAGEHTDVDNATLDAAVASGERAAAEIAAQV